MKSKILILVFVGIILTVFGVAVKIHNSVDAQADTNLQNKAVTENIIDSVYFTENEQLIADSTEIVAEESADEQADLHKKQAVKKAKKTPNSDKKLHKQAIFINFVAAKFSSKYFKVEKLYGKKRFGNSDLKVVYNFKNASGTFYLKVKWLKQYKERIVEIIGKEEIQMYKNFFQNNDSPLFKIIGIGGGQAQPKLLYAIPAQKLRVGKLTIYKLANFKKKRISSNFFYDMKNKMLR